MKQGKTLAELGRELQRQRLNRQIDVLVEQVGRSRLHFDVVAIRNVQPRCYLLMSVVTDREAVVVPVERQAKR